jgi:hypothetical protein
MRTWYPITQVILFIHFSCLCDENVSISAQIAKNRIRSVVLEIRLQSSAPIRELNLYRSSYNLNYLEKFNLSEYPITKVIIRPEKPAFTMTDSMVSDNCEYYYYARVKKNDGELLPCNVAHVKTGDIQLPPPASAAPEILVDKKNYFLEIKYGGKPVKRFPVSLGRDPFGRKVQQDCMTTPEGKYAISYFKPQSQFYKAMGVNYPTAADRARYARAKRMGLLDTVDGAIPSIGGAIQIHGGGIGNNWTWGCIAMRNHDIDELFQTRLLKVNTALWIVGSEFTRDSMNSLK